MKSLTQTEWVCCLWTADQAARSSRHLGLCIMQGPLQMTDLETVTTWMLALTSPLRCGGCRGEGVRGLELPKPQGSVDRPTGAEPMGCEGRGHKGTGFSQPHGRLGLGLAVTKAPEAIVGWSRRMGC
ncbi:hypothetical protein AAFF_G00232510 [Aldrovandia affinis]|uniref:Uncharacterized protein n=1 Tax=Aldrovandia affinis TaxID=143900 RepID=A0AAD7REZ6_9TELE|nr:hypothetical protein AAFF_G00232510 [Aldrovandia affinis]